MKKSVVRIPVFEKELDHCLGLLVSALPGEYLVSVTILQRLIELERLSWIFLRRYGFAGVEQNRKIMPAVGTNHAGILFEPTSRLLEVVAAFGAGERDRLVVGHAPESITSGLSSK